MNSKVRKSGWKVPQSKIYSEKEECEKWPSAIQLQMVSVAPSGIWPSSHWFSTFTECWIEVQSVRHQIPTQPCCLPSLHFLYLCWEHRLLCHLAIAHLTSIGPGSIGAVCCVFLTRSLTVCPTAGLRCHTGHSTCLVGSGPLVPPWPLAPASSHLHSTTSSSSCSTLKFLFSFTKIKNQAHNQAESS